MKTKFILFCCFVFLSFFLNSQSIDNINHIAPSQDGLIAIQRKGEWAFINEEGTIVIDFRDDLIADDAGSNKNYPTINSKRILIKEERDGISYFGYIDNNGQTVIEPQFLNAKNFSGGRSTVLKLISNTVGRNEILGKNTVYHRYCEVIIDENGKELHFLNPKGVNLVLDRKFLKEPPRITAKRISENLYAFKDKNKKWTIVRTKY